jgi:hypothetical protein
VNSAPPAQQRQKPRRDSDLSGEIGMTYLLSGTMDSQYASRCGRLSFKNLIISFRRRALAGERPENEMGKQ